MDGSGNQFLTRTCFTCDQHVNQTSCYPFDQAVDLPHRQTLTNEVFKGVGSLNGPPESLFGRPVAGIRQGLDKRIFEVTISIGQRQIIGCSPSQAGPGRLRIGTCIDNNDREVRVGLQDLREKIDRWQAVTNRQHGDIEAVTAKEIGASGNCRCLPHLKRLQPSHETAVRKALRAGWINDRDAGLTHGGLSVGGSKSLEACHCRLTCMPSHQYPCRSSPLQPVEAIGQFRPPAGSGKVLGRARRIARTSDPARKRSLLHAA
jgi:hypothetical protein